MTQKHTKINQEIFSRFIFQNFNLNCRLVSGELPLYLKQTEGTLVFEKEEEFAECDYRLVTIVTVIS